MPEQLLIEIRVRPNSSRNKVGGTVGEPPRLVVAVQAPAVDGKANEAVVKELAKAFEDYQKSVNGFEKGANWSSEIRHLPFKNRTN